MNGITTVAFTGCAAPTARTASSGLVSFGLAPGRALPAWLPAPPPAVRRVPTTTHARKACRTSLLPGRQSLGEKLLWLALAAAGAAGIGYGFNCLLDLVQHWAVFNAGIANLVG